MNGDGLLPLPLVDACTLSATQRALLRPDELFPDRDGCAHRLPRFFYQIDSWKLALETRLAEHFILSELMAVDVREASAMRAWPRFVPCAVTLLAAHLELLRQAVGTFVFISANGGYRSPGHALASHGSPHCWGTAANIYRIGDEYLDTQERIERFAKVVARVTPGVHVRPFGSQKGFADDHLHVDIGYARLVPATASEDEAP